MRFASSVRRATSAALALVVGVAQAVSSRVEARDVSLWVGLLSFGYGASLWWLPLAFMGPGAVLIWIALPRAPRRDAPPRAPIAEDR